VRQPLPALTVVVPGAEGLRPLAGQVAEEVNVKDVRLVDVADASEEDFGVRQQLTVNARAAGPRLGREVQLAIQAARAGSWDVDATGAVVAGGIVLQEGEYELSTVVDEAAGATATATLPGGGFVVLDTAVDEELAAEGWANDVVRQVQDARKAAGLHVADRISLVLEVPVEREAWARAAGDRIAAEVLATSVAVRPRADAADEVQVEVSRA
jgi:isoleucyl-tRNA synthetase